MPTTFPVFGDSFGFEKPLVLDPITLHDPQDNPTRRALRHDRRALRVAHRTGTLSAEDSSSLQPHLEDVSVVRTNSLTAAVHADRVSGATEHKAGNLLRMVAEEIQDGTALSVFPQCHSPEKISAAVNLFFQVASSIIVSDEQVALPMPIHLPTQDQEMYWANRHAALDPKEFLDDVLSCWEIGLHVLIGTHYLTKRDDTPSDAVGSAGVQLVRLHASDVRILGDLLDRLSYLMEFFLDYAWVVQYGGRQY